MRTPFSIGFYTLGFSLFVAFSASAQNRWPALERLDHIPTITIPSGVQITDAFDSESQTIWIWMDSLMLSVRHKTGQTTQYSFSIEEKNLSMAWVDSLRELRFWDKAVGRVWRWKPGMKSAQRIDRSFKHGNQLHHAAIIDPESGSIITYGGYGFWTVKNFFTYFDTTLKEWEVNPKYQPEGAPFLSHSGMILNKVDNKIYFAGGFQTGGSLTLNTEELRLKSNFDVFIFDPEKNRFEDPNPVIAPPGNPVYQLKPVTGYPNYNPGSTVPRFSTRHQVWFLFAVFGKEKADTWTTYLRTKPALLDLRTNRLLVNQDFSLEPDAGFQIVDMIWMEEMDELTVLVQYVNSNSALRNLIFYRLKMTTFFDHFDASINELHPSLLREYSGALSLAALFVLGGLMGIVLYRQFVKPHAAGNGTSTNSQPGKYELADTNDPKTAVFTLVGTARLIKGNVDLIHGIDPVKKEFLTALLLEAAIRDKGIDTIELDELLFKPTAQESYIRKMRNVHFHELNQFMLQHFGLTEAIFYFRSENDRRRSIYRIKSEIFDSVRIDPSDGKLPDHQLKKRLYQILKSLLDPQHPLTSLFRDTTPI